MRIVYRMRGLLGDATEEFIESLDSTTGTIPSTHGAAHWTWGFRPHGHVQGLGYSQQILSQTVHQSCGVTSMEEKYRHQGLISTHLKVESGQAFSGEMQLATHLSSVLFLSCFPPHW